MNTIYLLLNFNDKIINKIKHNCKEIEINFTDILNNVQQFLSLLSFFIFTIINAFKNVFTNKATHTSKKPNTDIPGLLFLK